MNDSTIVIIIYGTIALICGITGFAALRYGVNLYLQGTGLKSEGSVIRIGDVKINVKTTGFALMITSAFWGLLAWQILPNYDDGSTTISQTISIDSESFVAKTIKADVFDTYTSSVRVDSVNSIRGWSKLAENDITEAQVLMSYGYKNGIGFPTNIDSSKFWLVKALKSEFALSESVSIDSLKSTTAFMEIFKSIPKRKELASEDQQ